MGVQRNGASDPASVIIGMGTTVINIDPFTTTIIQQRRATKPAATCFGLSEADCLRSWGSEFLAVSQHGSHAARTRTGTHEASCGFACVHTRAGDDRKPSGLACVRHKSYDSNGSVHTRAE